MNYSTQDPGNDMYLLRLVIAFDIFMNAVFGGKLGETISARCEKGAIAGNKIAKFMRWWLNLIESNHCAKAAVNDEIRAREAYADLEKETGLTPK